MCNLCNINHHTEDEWDDEDLDDLAYSHSTCCHATADTANLQMNKSTFTPLQSPIMTSQASSF